MSWSKGAKIHRGVEEGALKPWSYVEFGPNGETIAPPKVEAVPAPAAPKVPAPAPAEKSGRAPEAALAEALARGRQEGAREAEQRFGKTVEALTLALEEISRLRESLLTNASQDMLHLVLTIARQVIEAELTVKGEIVLKTIERALQAAVRADAYHLRVHPDDLTLVAENRPLFLARVSGLRNLTLEGDPAVGRGGCRLESQLGEVDATIESQLEVIRRTLSEAIAG